MYYPERRKILIAEADNDISATLTIFLETDGGFSCEQIHQTELLQALSKGAQIHAIIYSADHINDAQIQQLKKIDKTIQKDSPETRLIILTTQKGEQLQDAFRQTYPNGFSSRRARVINKPFDIDELLRHVVQ